jgi:hypothetical protein
MRFKLVAAATISSALPFALLVASPACKDRVIIPHGEGGAGVGGAGSSTSTLEGSGGKDGGGKDAFPDYTDPGCMNQPPPIEDFECDPYSQGNGDCTAGNACYIYVDYPSEPCGQETYGAVCEPAGIGGQGDPCQGATDCIGGAACVVTGSGTQCVMLCPLMGPSGCPSGTVCEPIDVEGYGGCL